MNIHVGSLNPTKLEAVRNIVSGHHLFGNATVKGVSVEIEEFGHPKSLKETISGAKNRAKMAFGDCNYSLGLESGLLKAPSTKSGYLETTACAIYDGHKYYIGLGPAFEWPEEMVELIFQGMDGSQAFKHLGLTNHEKLGIAEGGIFVLTHGKVNRVKLNEMAFLMALLQLENPDYY